MMSLDERTALASTLVALERIAPQVTESFFALHPEWGARYGERGRHKCTEDARVYLLYLAGAVQAGRAETFVEYVRWAISMLAARNLDSSYVREHLDLLGQELASLLRPAEAALVAAYLAAACDALMQGSVADPEPVVDLRTPIRIAYLNAALGGRREDAHAVARSALRDGWSHQDVYRDLLAGCQRRLGELWVQGAISVAQEHMASAVTQWTIARLYVEAPISAPARGRILMAGVEGELHALPAHCAADQLELLGWEVVFVGTNVPSFAILSAILEHKPDIIGLSVTMPFHLAKTVALIRAIREVHADLRIVLGGRAVHGAEDLGVELGVEVDAAGDLGPFRR